jgi:anti-anti-sigma factor
MPLNEWSQTILVGELSDEPGLTDDLQLLLQRSEGKSKEFHVILDFSSVTYINSSNLAQILQLRKVLAASKSTLHLCGVKDGVWSILLMTGLDRLFKFTDDLPTALAAAQTGI